MICKIRWLTPTDRLSQEAYQTIKNSNIPQSYSYARSQARLKSQTIHSGLIEIDDQPAGLIQSLEAGILWNAIHGVILDRGPLWFDGYGSLEHFEAVCRALAIKFPSRFGRKRRFIPEIEDSLEARDILHKTGFRHREGSAYQTYMLDLTPDADALHKGLKKRWRNSLTKAQKQNLDIRVDDKGQLLLPFLKAYTLQKAQKGYDGPSVSLIEAITKYAIPRGELLICQAYKNEKPISGILLFTHGRGATYQIGWNTNAGRENGAHYVLLWTALEKLKQRGIENLDLGGINDEDAKSLKTFKEGLGGHLLRLPGIFY